MAAPPGSGSTDGQAFLDHVANHRSYRDFDGSREVSRECLHKVLQTAMRSSNNGNMQTYSIIATRNPATKKELALIHDNPKIADAPVLLTFLSDWTRMNLWCKCRGAFPEGGEDGEGGGGASAPKKRRTGDGSESVEPDPYSNFNAYLTGAFDAMVTAQSVALCAEAEGLGVCFLGSTIWEPQRLHALLKIPKGAHVVTSVMLGYPKPDVAISLKARLPFEAFVHEEEYQPMAAEQAAELYAEREIEGWNRYINLYGKAWGEKLKTHDLKNLAQVYTCLKYSGSDFRLWSRKFLSSLEEQGFSSNQETAKDAEVLEKGCAVCAKKSHCLDPARFSTN